MPWQPLPQDVPLDHEALPPPEHLDAPADAPANLAPLPDDAQLDEPQTVERTKATDAPIIIAAIRPEGAPKRELKAEEVDPRVSVAGFDGEVAPDTQYHTALSDADKKEYASFFKDPKSPPSAAQIGLWYHQKTGAFLSNAQDIVDAFKQTGKFQTQERITVPTKHQNAGAAFTNHTANAVVADWGPEGAAVLDALGLGGKDRPNIFNSDGSLSDIWANNADLERAQLDQDSADHPIASTAGELTGVALATPLLAKAGNAAGLAKVAETNGEVPRALIQQSGEGFAYGSGAGGPGHRMEGGATGAAMVPAVAGAAKLPLAAVDAGKTVLQGSPGLARRIIAKAIKDDMNTPESVGQAIGEAHANGVPMALGDTGENVRGLLAASSRASGVGRTVVRDALETRQAALADRITGAIERDLGPVANPHQVADDLMSKARTEAAPIYDRFYQSAPVSSPAIDAMVQRPSMQKALKNAYRIAQEEGRDPEALGFKVGEDGKVSAEAAPPSSESFPEPSTLNTPRSPTAPEMEKFGRVQSVPLGQARRGNKLEWDRFNRGDHGEPLVSGYGAKPVAVKLENGEYVVLDGNHRVALAKKSGAREMPMHVISAKDYDPANAGRKPAARGMSDDDLYAALSDGEPTKPSAEMVKTYSPQTLDYIKRGMDDVVEGYRDPTTGKLNLDTEGRAVNNTLRSYMGVVDQLYPDYAKARAAYAGPVSGINALNLGRKFLNMTADDIEARMRDMSPFEKQMAASGTRRAMAELVSSKGDTADIVHALVGTGKKRAMLARLFGDRKQFQRFVDTLGQEKEGWRSFKQALLGSPTAANAKDDQLLEGAAMAADFAAGGMPVATATSKAIKLFGFKLSEKAQQQIAALLSDTNPAAIRELASELRAQAEKRGLRVRKRNVATGAIGKGALVSQQRQ